MIADFILGLFKKLLPVTSYSVKRETEEKIKVEWEKINNLMKLGGPSNLRQALISADKTLDNAMRDITDPALTSMGERLKMCKNRFDMVTYQKLWEAHKIRNNLVHESGYEPSHYVIKQAVDDLKYGVKSLGVRI